MLVRCREPPDAGGWQFSRMNFRATVLPRKGSTGSARRRRRCASPLLPAPGNAAMRTCPTVGPALRRHSVGRRLPEEMRHAHFPGTCDIDRRQCGRGAAATGGNNFPPLSALSSRLPAPGRQGARPPFPRRPGVAARPADGRMIAVCLRMPEPSTAGMPHGTTPEKTQALPPEDRACADGGPGPQRSVFSTRPGTTWHQPA